MSIQPLSFDTKLKIAGIILGVFLLFYWLSGWRIS